MRNIIPPEPRQPIGFIGFNNRKQVETIVSHIPPDFCQQVMIGVSVEYIGPEDGEILPENFSRTTDLANIFRRCDRDHPNGGPLIENFVYYRSPRRPDLLEQLQTVMTIAGGNMDGLFLNLIWPSTGVLDRFRALYPDTKLFLKIGAKAYQRVGGKPNDLVRELHDYHGLVDRVVLNPFDDQRSGSFNIRTLDEIIQPLCESNKFYLAVAGRIGPDDLKTFSVLIERYPGIGVFFYRSLLDDEGNFIHERAIGLLQNGPCNLAAAYLGK